MLHIYSIYVWHFTFSNLQPNVDIDTQIHQKKKRKTCRKRGVAVSRYMGIYVCTTRQTAFQKHPYLLLFFPDFNPALAFCIYLLLTHHLLECPLTIYIVYLTHQKYTFKKSFWGKGSGTSLFQAGNERLYE